MSPQSTSVDEPSRSITSFKEGVLDELLLKCGKPPVVWCSQRLPEPHACGGYITHDQLVLEDNLQ